MANRSPNASGSTSRQAGRRHRLARPVLFLILLTAAAAAMAADAVRVVEVRLGNWPDRVRLVLESDREIAAEQHYDEGELALHLPAVDPDSLERALAATPPERHRLIVGRQLQLRRDGVPILILELADEVAPQLLRLRPQDGHGWRLVLDLRFLRQGPVAVAAQPRDLPAEQASLLERVLSEAPASRPAAEPLPTPSASPPAAPAINTLRAVRLGRWPDRVRLVIESEQPLGFALPDGDHGSALTLQLEPLPRAPLAAALQAALRGSRQRLLRASLLATPESPRLALTLAEPSRLRVFNLPPENGFGHRLVIDAVPDPAPAPAARPVASVTHAPPISRSTGTVIVPARRPIAATPYRWLDARINGQRSRRTVLALRDDTGHWWLSERDLRDWRLRVDAPARVEDGERWHSLDALGIAHVVDEQQQTLALTAPVTRFAASALTLAAPPALAPSASPVGAFVNYDISLTDDGSVTGGGLFELGAFGRAGSGSSTLLLARDQALDSYRWRRLETGWRIDDPARMRTLQFGDGITRATAWSGAVRFAGVQWRRNFATRPEFVSAPLLGIAGEAALPSVVELYVNDALRMRSEVAPGPFRIEDIPTVTGSGSARLVVRDLLGREQLIEQPYYAAPQLLARGLYDWSWEVGRVRENYGLASFDYGQALLTTTQRYGLTDAVTGELHLQWSERARMFGLGLAYSVPGGALLQLAAAGSRSAQGTGRYLSLGLQHQGRRFGAGVVSEYASAGFRRLGQAEQRSLPAQQHRAYASSRLGSGSLSLSWTLQRRRLADRLAGDDDVDLVTLGYGRQLGRLAWLGVSLLRDRVHDDLTVASVLTLPLGAGRTLAVNAESADGEARASLQWQQSPPAGPGVGYRARLGLGPRAEQQAGVVWQTEQGRWLADVAAVDGDTAVRLGAAGGLGMIAGHRFLSRAVTDAVALVEVPGRADVRVYADHQLVTRTDADGFAVLPRLRAYERNRIEIEQADLPLQIEVDTLAQEIAPNWRSGAVLRFAVQQGRIAWLRIVDADGRPLPAGSEVFDDGGRRWPVGHRGEAWLTGLSAHNRLSVRHDGVRCRLAFAAAEHDQPPEQPETTPCTDSVP